jgi:hypothetical protein
MKHALLTSAALALLLAAGVSSTQIFAQGGPPAPMPAPAVDVHDISGYWSLPYDMRRVPPASLLPTVTRAKLDAVAKSDAHAIRWCNLPGMPTLMDVGRPLNIRQGRTQIILVSESNASPRYIYFRDKHVSPDIFDPSTSGDSMARWEGDALIVDTIGFANDRGIRSLPGGGYRTENTRLVEKYRLLDNGNTLAVTFTWIDPKVFRTPHSYEYRYTRMPSSYEPQPPAGCNPYDEARVKFLEGPVVAANAPAAAR